MNLARMSFVTAILFFASMHLLAADSHKLLVEKITSQLNAKRATVVDNIADIDAQLKARGVESKPIGAARQILADMLKAPQWRRLSSRTTSTRQEAAAALQEYVNRANKQLAEAQSHLAALKRAEYVAWAQEHPEEARMRSLEAAALNAQNAAWQAQAEARQAQHEAATARQDAERARWDAQNALRRARNAQQRADDVEQQQFHRSLHGW